MKNSKLTPTNLRIILSIVLILLAGLAVVVFLLGYEQIKTHAAAAQEVSTKAQASQSSLNNLINTEKFLDANKSSVQRAAELVSESKSYVYQDQIIADLNKFASEAGLSIVNITFTDTKTAKTGSTTSTASSSTSTAAAAAKTPTPPGVKIMTATVLIKNPTGYDNMLNFIHLIEQSLFKMQVSQISLSKSTDEKTKNQVSSDVLTVEVYVR